MSGESLEDPSVAPVLEGVHDLLPDARVPQGRSGAHEAEVHALALVADEALEGRRHPAAGIGYASDQAQRLEALQAEQVARAPVASDAALGVEEICKGGDVGL